MWPISAMKRGLARLLLLTSVHCGADTTPGPEVEAPRVSRAALLSACAGDFDTTDANAESASFTVTGSVAVLRGVLGTRTPARVRTLLENPEVRIVVMSNVPGSDDDDGNLEAARLIYAANLGICVPDNGTIASGGVDFFLAGRTRALGENTFVGVHAWLGQNGVDGSELPRSDPEHDFFLDYYADINVDPDFYWFTLEAAPASSIHNMTDAERTTWAMETL